MCRSSPKAGPAIYSRMTQGTVEGPCELQMFWSWITNVTIVSHILQIHFKAVLVIVVAYVLE